MAELKAEFQCGCGYRTKSPTECVKHSDDRQHKMWIRGDVKPDPDKNPNKK